MSRGYFDTTENAELRAKIDWAKQQLPLPDLIRQLGYEEKRKTARCPFHEDKHPSFSVFQSKDGKGWQWKCHAGCGHGDEIDFLAKHVDISRREAIRRYLDRAGFPRGSRECSEPAESSESSASPEFSECPELAVDKRYRQNSEL